MFPCFFLSFPFSQTPEVVGKLMMVFDLDRSHNIGLFEFVPLWNFVQKIRGSFAAFDRDHSGTLEWNELGGALGQSGMHISPPHLMPLMAKFDPQKTGRLTMDNYTALCLYLANLRTFFDNQKWKRKASKQDKKAQKKAKKYGGAGGAGAVQETASMTFDELVGASQYFLA
jgi:EF-hand domain pair